MSKTEELKQQFITSLELFVQECDAKEEFAEWDYEERGHMAAFYQNDMISFLVRLIGTDGDFSEKEAQLLDETFGFRYSADELSEIYKLSESEIVGETFNSMLEAGIRELYSIDSNMGKMYTDILFLICEMMAECDGFVYSKEKEELENLKAIIDEF